MNTTPSESVDLISKSIQLSDSRLKFRYVFARSYIPAESPGLLEQSEVQLALRICPLELLELTQVKSLLKCSGTSMLTL